MVNNYYNNEEMVKLYQETKEERYLKLILQKNEGFIRFCSKYAFKIISNNKNLAVREADWLMEKEDVLQEGYIGLLKAVRKFDVNKSVKFTTFASKCIAGSMLEYLKKEIEYRLNTSCLELEVEALEIDPYNLLLKYDVERMIESTLNPLEQRVIVLHYGLNEGSEHSIEEINKLLSIGNAKYLIQKSLKKLRETDAAKEYKKEFYREKVRNIEGQNINPEIKVIAKICYEEILENL